MGNYFIRRPAYDAVLPLWSTRQKQKFKLLKRERFSIGKVHAKFLILEILSYSEWQDVSAKRLTSISQVSYNFLIKNYTYFKRIVPYSLASIQLSSIKFLKKASLSHPMRLEKISLYNVPSQNFVNVFTPAGLNLLRFDSWVLDPYTLKNLNVKNADLRGFNFNEIIITKVTKMKGFVEQLPFLPQNIRKLKISDDVNSFNIIDDSYMPRGFSPIIVEELTLEVLYFENIRILLDYVKPKKVLNIKFMEAGRTDLSKLSRLLRDLDLELKRLTIDMEEADINEDFNVLQCMNFINFRTVSLKWITVTVDSNTKKNLENLRNYGYLKNKEECAIKVELKEFQQYQEMFLQSGFKNYIFTLNFDPIEIPQFSHSSSFDGSIKLVFEITHAHFLDQITIMIFNAFPYLKTLEIQYLEGNLIYESHALTKDEPFYLQNLTTDKSIFSAKVKYYSTLITKASHSLKKLIINRYVTPPEGQRGMLQAAGTCHNLTDLIIQSTYSPSVTSLTSIPQIELDAISRLHNLQVLVICDTPADSGITSFIKKAFIQCTLPNLQVLYLNIYIDNPAEVFFPWHPSLLQLSLVQVGQKPLSARDAYEIVKSKKYGFRLEAQFANMEEAIVLCPRAVLLPFISK
ncbi:hypothetical protein FGO68_gene14497 [Halteria grandinella]|uniref:Uncharacterized protein n=1 Tax=Halteria grandinella TaxID=5974 RepID=A0A8J8NU75_HALGN|nr:hypothetical protein FGO68_gene14497 [Halteria grandinella]